mmetsp:Transcript_19515/g.58796  ORF Transcript_19515/g.58796 Transcript_19515/m.58796 type:complete len:123 (-) Transcript_19515:25-393(-)
MVSARVFLLLAAAALPMSAFGRDAGLAAPSAKPQVAKPRAVLGLADLEEGPRVQTAVLVCVGPGQCEQRLAGFGISAEAAAQQQRDARELAEKQGFACGGRREPCYGLPNPGAAVASTLFSI